MLGSWTVPYVTARNVMDNKFTAIKLPECIQQKLERHNFFDAERTARHGIFWVEPTKLRTTDGYRTSYFQRRKEAPWQRRQWHPPPGALNPAKLHVNNIVL